VRVGHVELTFLGIAHLDIVEVGERYHRGAAYAAGDHALAYLADDIVHVDGTQTAPLAPEHALAREGEEARERLGTARLPAHRLEARAGGANSGEIKGDVSSRIPCLQTERERVAPALLRIGDDVRPELLAALFHNLRELFDVLTLYREADAASLHREIHDFGEVFELYWRGEGAVVSAGITAARRFARELHEAHGRHHFLLQDA